MAFLGAILPEDQAAGGVVIRFAALSIAPEMLLPRPTADAAMPAPTMARISAYSAAAAPDHHETVCEQKIP
jgi:hypothetical protein